MTSYSSNVRPPSAVKKTKLTQTDGFFLDDNPNDAIFLDDIILREFTLSDRKALSSRITQPTHEQRYTHTSHMH
jgi:hypothetical protein